MKKPVYLILVFAALSIAAIGNSVYEFPRWMDLARVSGAGWGVHHAVGGSGATGFAGETNAGYTATDESTLRCFPWNSTVEITCELEVSAYVTMDDDVTVGSAATHGAVTDPGTPADGVGNVKWIEPNQKTEIWIHWSAWPNGAVAAGSTPGYRSGACSSPAGLAGYPCDADNDCPTGACSASTVPTCAFVSLAGGAATTCKIGQGR